MSDSEAPNEIPNEIIAAAAHAKAAKERAAVTDKKSWPIAAIGLGVGIGSAAVAAAMLFAGRNKD